MTEAKKGNQTIYLLDDTDGRQQQAQDDSHEAVNRSVGQVSTLEREFSHVYVREDVQEDVVAVRGHLRDAEVALIGHVQAVDEGLACAVASADLCEVRAVEVATAVQLGGKSAYGRGREMRHHAPCLAA